MSALALGLSYIFLYAILGSSQYNWVNDFINLVIFISIIVFIFCIGKINKNIRVFIRNLIIIYCILNGTYSFAIKNMCVHKAISPEKKCFNIIITITNAVTDYNMNISEKDFMKELDLDKLIEKGYIKDFTPPEKTCKYENTGDLSEDGLVYCEIHGSPEFERMLSDNNDKNKEVIAKRNIKIPEKFYRNRKSFNPNFIREFFISNDYLFPIRFFFFPDTYNHFR